MLRVFLVDDSAAASQALADWLGALGDFEIVGMAASEMEATEWLQHRNNHWDVVIIDLLIDGGSGFNLINRAKQSSAKGCTVVFSAYVTPIIAKRCADLGAAAAFNKSEPEKMLDFLGGLQGAGSFRRSKQ